MPARLALQAPMQACTQADAQVCTQVCTRTEVEITISADGFHVGTVVGVLPSYPPASLPPPPFMLVT